MEAAMGSVAMYLEGPGQERRPVKLLSTRTMPVKPGLSDGRRIAHRSSGEIEVRTLIDDEGKIANQIDFDGFKFKYRESEIQWSLLFG